MVFWREPRLRALLLLDAAERIPGVVGDATECRGFKGPVGSDRGMLSRVTSSILHPHPTNATRRGPTSTHLRFWHIWLSLTRLTSTARLHLRHLQTIYHDHDSRQLAQTPCFKIDQTYRRRPAPPCRHRTPLAGPNQSHQPRLLARSRRRQLGRFRARCQDLT